MNKKEMKKNNSLDEQLAVFTDQVLADNAPETQSNNPELQELQNTVIRMKSAFHENTLSDTTAKRMQIDFMVKVKSQQTIPQTSALNRLRTFWGRQEKWQSQRRRQRLGIAISMAALVLLLLVVVPLLDTTGSNQTAASGQTLKPIVLIVFGGLVLLILWTFRPKS